MPYIQQLSGTTIVIKFGGNAMTDDALKNNFARDVVLLKQVGCHPVIIHGGGPQITEHLEKQGIESNFANGMRITDEKSIDIIEMVLGGLINKDIVNTITSLGGKAVGLSGKDGGLIRAKKIEGEGEFKNIDFKNTGTVKSIDPGVVKLLDGSTFIPVIAPIGIGDDGKTYNINFWRRKRSWEPIKSFFWIFLFRYYLQQSNSSKDSIIKTIPPIIKKDVPAHFASE